MIEGAAHRGPPGIVRAAKTVPNRREAGQEMPRRFMIGKGMFARRGTPRRA